MVDMIKDTIEKLKSEKLKPASKLQFLTKKILKWLLVFLAAVFGGLALAAILFLIPQFDWDMHQKFGGPFSFGLRFLPFFWIIVGGLLVFAVYEAVRHTKSGYRYDWKKMAVIVAGLVVGVGALAHFADFGRRADFAARKNVPGYGMMVPEMKDQWMDPENGFLAGEIVSVGERKLQLKDFDGNDWTVFLDEETFTKPRVSISNGQGIKIIGKKISESEFNADEIRPWVGNRMQREFDHDEFHERYDDRLPRVRGYSDENFGPRGPTHQGLMMEDDGTESE